MVEMGKSKSSLFFKQKGLSKALFLREVDTQDQDGIV